MLSIEKTEEYTLPLSKDIWWYIADKYLTNIEIHSVMNSCKGLQLWLNSHPRLTVKYIPYKFWKDLIDGLQYSILEDILDDECCLLIEGIDRGVQDFEQFGQLLKKSYPNIRELSFYQNYAYNEHLNFDWEKNFIAFISLTKLQFLKIDDYQTPFFCKFDWENIIKYMPEYSEYIIKSNIFDDCPPYCQCENEKILKQGSKTLKLHIHPHHRII